MSTNQLNKGAIETTPKQKNKKQSKRENKDKNDELDVKTRKEQKRKQKEERRKGKKPRRRIFPIWLRIITVLVFCAIALVTGAMIGYGIIGDGVPKDVLKKETWEHIIDIVTKAK